MSTIRPCCNRLAINRICSQDMGIQRSLLISSCWKATILIFALQIEQNEAQKWFLHRWTSAAFALNLPNDKAESQPLSDEGASGPIRYRARVAYDGARFVGFQFQPKKRTIQGDLEEVLSTRFDQKVRVVGAGRTDTGVHARGQAFHFELKPGSLKEEDLPSLEYSLNRMLRQDMRVWNIQVAPQKTKMLNGREVTLKWNAIHDTKGKLYTYRISAAKSMDPLERHTRFNLSWFPDIDISILACTLKHYEGTHDFRAFAGGIDQLERKLGGEMDTKRTVYSVDLIDEGEGLYRIEIRLKGALYRMVRNMVGTALEVARGRISEEFFLGLLNRVDSADRKKNKCKPAPPEGLTLEQVFYDDFD